MVSQRRFLALDSLRGLASFSVVVGHSMTSYAIFLAAISHQPMSSGVVSVLTYSPAHLLWASHEAVILFFVLSGFVLGLPYMDNRESDYLPYVVKRFCRIYLPYAVVVAVAVVLMTLPRTHGEPGLSSWFNGMWAQPVSMRGVQDLIFMLGQSNHNVDTSTWSLVHEMRISLFFPLLAFFVRRVDWKFTLTVAVVLPLASRILLVTSSPFSKSAYDTLYYTPFFLIGAAIAKHRLNLQVLVGGLSKPLAYGGLVFGLVLYIFSWLFPLEFLVSKVILTDWLTAVGSVILIVASISLPAVTSLLEHRWLVWVGKISYSLYLVHPIVLLSMVYGLRNYLPLSLIIVLVPVVSLLIGGATHRLIEAPTMRLGHFASNRISAFQTPLPSKEKREAW